MPKAEAEAKQDGAVSFLSTAVTSRAADAEALLSWRALKAIGAGFWLTDPQFLRCERRLINQAGVQLHEVVIQHIRTLHVLYIAVMRLTPCVRTRITLTETYLMAAGVRERAEELTKAQYAATRDPAACALLYAALGKKSRLQGAHSAW